ncbi:MAG: histidine--tRNA ligase [Geminicoccaceae bacterium]
MANLRPVRGTHDLFGDEMLRHRALVERARAVAAVYGYGEIATPIFEFTEVFARTLGETSDVVSKEMYTFEDRGGELITLRPENTAGICRAMVSNGMQQNLPAKLFYYGPMFRYERPQKGRLRQFHQIGVEVLGAPEPLADVEVIALGWRILSTSGINAPITLELNTLGDVESRVAYRDALVGYLRNYEHELSADSRARLERNPLRILDSKDENDRRILVDAPDFTTFLNPDSRAFFDEICKRLDALGLPFTLNPHLVRGLDYYGHTAFEFTTTALGAQSAVLAGGRYDGLIASMGGPSIPGVGWAAGVERLTMLVERPAEQATPIAIVPMDEAEIDAALILAEELRAAGFVVDMAFKGKAGARLKRAAKTGARYACLIGAEELINNTVTLRDMDSGAQETIGLRALYDRLRD